MPRTRLASWGAQEALTEFKEKEWKQLENRPDTVENLQTASKIDENLLKAGLKSMCSTGSLPRRQFGRSSTSTRRLRPRARTVWSRASPCGCRAWNSRRCAL